MEKMQRPKSKFKNSFDVFTKLKILEACRLMSEFTMYTGNSSLKSSNYNEWVDLLHLYVMADVPPAVRNKLFL